MIRISVNLKSFSSFFFRQGFQCYLVGGAVRDALLSRKVVDYDIATDALPEDVMKMFYRVIPTGIKHGTVTVLFKKTTFEVTTFRIESDYRDGRRPESVIFTPSILEDLKRRDFTINALAYDLKTGELLDPHEGREDLKKGIIRAIGNPDERFGEDGLRPVRACRFAAQFNFKIETETFSGIRRSLETVTRVSAERIGAELVRLLAAEKPSIGFKAMLESDLLELLIPELSLCGGVEQGEPHCFDVFEHLLFSCDAAPRDNLIVRLAALFHDLGKPETRLKDDEGHLSFHGHEKLSARMASEITRRFKFPNLIIERTAHLIREHMFNYTEEWSDAAIRRFIARVGEMNIPDLLSLRRADQIGRCGNREVSYPLIKFEKRILKVLAGERALTIKDLKVNGKDLMDLLSIPPGPRVGLILNYLLESVLDDPHLNRRQALLEIARSFYASRLKLE